MPQAHKRTGATSEPGPTALPASHLDTRAADTAAITRIQADSGLPIEMHQLKDLNNRAKQGHRAVKRITLPMRGFKTFRRARIPPAGIEVMHMIRNGQLGAIKDWLPSAANQLCTLAF